MKDHIGVPMLLVAFALGASQCKHEDISLEPGECANLAQERTQDLSGRFDGVDLLVVVDDSGSMAEEQAILSTQFFTLVNSLVFPTADWSNPPVPSLRIAVASSDMGVQFGGGGVAGDEIESLVGCYGRGKNGLFQGYGERTIHIRPGGIKCDLDADPITQCPTGWTCDQDDANNPLVGRCYDPVGDGSDQQCPTLTDTKAETPIDGVPNYSVAFQAACLTGLGTEGCGFEQQLQAAAKGLIHPDNNPDPDKTFYRDNYLLAILVVSDEEDCSIEDGKLYKVDELDPMKDPHEFNIACGMHEEYLYTIDHFLDHFRRLKADDYSTVFAAIVGVPPRASDGEPNPCEGRGSEIKDCLDRDEMEKVVVTEMTNGEQEFKVFREACTREEDGELVTKARPGRRYVELAQKFGDFGYVASICSSDWTPVMSEIAALISRQSMGTCFPKQVQWDPAVKKAKCDLNIEYEHIDACPFELEPGAVAARRTETVNDVVREYLDCPLPRLPADLDCQIAEQDPLLSDPNVIGWYYCEDHGEDFEQACDPQGTFAGIDEDQDGLADCQDPDCWRCETCMGQAGVDPNNASSDCSHSCKFKVQLSPGTKEFAWGHRLYVACPRAGEICG